MVTPAQSAIRFVSSVTKGVTNSVPKHLVFWLVVFYCTSDTKSLKEAVAVYIDTVNNSNNMCGGLK